MTRWQTIIGQLEESGIRFQSGLTDADVSRVEDQYGFRFPPDLREFVQAALPQGDKFPDWRSGDDAVLRDWLNLPREGVLFDVEHNSFWLPEWGQRPTILGEALRLAGELVSAAGSKQSVELFSHLSNDTMITSPSKDFEISSGAQMQLLVGVSKP